MSVLGSGSVAVPVPIFSSRDRGGTKSEACDASAGAQTGAGDSEDLRERVRKRSRSGMDDTRPRAWARMQVGLGPEEEASVSIRMGEVERGMLLAVLERAWLGV